jgi:hypothetical protein
MEGYAAADRRSVGTKTKCGAASVRSELLANAIYEKLNTPASRTTVHVEPLLLYEQFTKVAERTPTSSLMESLGSNVVQLAAAPRAHNRIRFRLLPRLEGIGFVEVEMLDAVFRRAATPADIETVLDVLATLHALPHSNSLRRIT